MPRIVIYSDAPSVITGFGTVVRNVFLPMVESNYLRREDLSFFGINFSGEPHNLPFNIWPACIGMSSDRDPYGRVRFVDMVMKGALGSFDILFFLLDHFSLAQPININNQMVPFVPAVVQIARQQPNRAPFKVVQYVPVDSERVRPEWVTWMPQFVDRAVAYTHFGKRVLLDTCPSLSDRLSVIPHGTNPELFHTIPTSQREDFRRNVLKLKPGQPLISNINRNQPRKDVSRTLQIFAHVRKAVPDVKLYLHCNVVDSMGFNLDRTRQDLCLPADSVVFPGGFNEGVGLPIDALNLIYNATDIMLTTARGEGHGLTTTEAMCTGLPVVAPDHTSFSEILAEGRGILVPPEPERQIMIADNDQLRPVADVRAMADAVIWALKNPDKAREIGQKGKEWADKLSWRTTVVPMWKALFEELTQPAKPQPVTMPKRMAFNLGGTTP